MNSEQVVPPLQTSHTERIGRRIRRARLARNLTQGELARGIFSVSYISAVERGQIRPSLMALEQLATRLQVHISELLSDEHDAEIDAAIIAGEGWTTSSEQASGEITARLREAQSLSRLGRVDEAIRLLQEAISQHPAPRDLALTRSYLAAAYSSQKQLEAARGELQEAMAIAEQIGDRDLLERCRYDLGQVYNELDQPLLAFECHRACYNAIQRGVMRDAGFKLNVLSTLGQEYLALGAPDDAIQVLEEAAALSDRLPSRERLGDVYQALSNAYRVRGDVARAKRSALLSIQSYEEASAKRQAAHMHTWLGNAYLDSNQLEDAEAHLLVARDIARKQDDTRGLSEAARGLSTLYVRRKDYAEAEKQARAALEAGVGDVVLHAEALIALGDVLRAQGKRREAERQVRQALQAIEGAEPARRRAPALAAAAAFYEAEGDAARALECLKRAWQAKGGSALW